MQRFIDCDVHHEVTSSEAVIERLDEGWREYVRGSGIAPPLAVQPNYVYFNPNTPFRAELPWDDNPPGSSPALMKEELLEPHAVEAVTLTHESGLYIGGFRNPYFARELARVYNDDMVDRWLEPERRCFGMLTLPIQVPQFAADEIDRIGGHEKVAGVVLAANGLGPPFGHPVFEPVHRAAAEAGLPIAIHSLGDGVAGTRGPALAGTSGPSFYLEQHTGATQGLMTHLMSFIAHGVFERYPTLKLVLLEGGVAWIPAFLRRFDTNFHALRNEVPWCTRAPSEVFRAHVRVSTQPFEVSSANDPLLQDMQDAGFDEVLLFASDYPHWDADVVTQTEHRLPEAWREAVMWRNARATYRFR